MAESGTLYKEPTGYSSVCIAFRTAHKEMEAGRVGEVQFKYYSLSVALSSAASTECETLRPEQRPLESAEHVNSVWISIYCTAVALQPTTIEKPRKEKGYEKREKRKAIRGRSTGTVHSVSRTAGPVYMRQ
ncbi:hypothetical protein NDU88_001307 [Pleurodeles waltl]|uniref:Uncharacterized protein n=1 Tax=Pleurodeles waltl TaxID=8319 RepID=A0AAV7THY5_PLEWA|nr:hypothetical protein NDU88_001307 [Pleurodeles waltl]